MCHKESKNASIDKLLQVKHDLAKVKAARGFLSSQRERRARRERCSRKPVQFRRCCTRSVGHPCPHCGVEHRGGRGGGSGRRAAVRAHSRRRHVRRACARAAPLAPMRSAARAGPQPSDQLNVFRWLQGDAGL